MSINRSDINGLREQAIHDLGECDPFHCHYCPMTKRERGDDEEGNSRGSHE